MTATALLLLVPLAAPAADPPAEQSICTRSLLTWVSNLQSKDTTTQRAAYEALVKAGPKAKSVVPMLVKLLGEKDAPVHQVADVLGAIGPDAKEAVPALLAKLPKEESWGYGVETIAHAVAKIDGPKPEATRALLLSSGRCTPIYLVSSNTLAEYPAQVVPQIVALCSDKDAKVRAKAATVLGTLKYGESLKVPTKSLFEKAGDGAKGVVPALEKLLADDDTGVRLEAAVAVALVAPELAEKAIRAVVAVALDDTRAERLSHHQAWQVFHAAPVPAASALVPLFDHPSDRVRNWAISTLTPLPVREPVEAALKDGKTARIRECAARALGARYSSGAESVPALTAALADPAFAVRFAAGKALVNVGPRGSAANAAAVPALVEGLQQTDGKVRAEAGQTLQTVGPTAKAAVPALQKLLDDPKPEVRLEAALALVAIEPKEAAAGVPALADGLKTADEHTAVGIAKALTVLGPVAKAAVPELVKKFDAGAPLVRLYSAEAVARIDPEHAPKAVAVIVALLKNKKYRSHVTRRYAPEALRRIGPAAKSAVPALAALLTDDEGFHADIAVAMIAVDPDAANPAFGWVRKVLSDESPAARENLDQLQELGPAAATLVPELIAALKSKKLYQERAAIQTLAAIGPGARDAVPALKAVAASDPVPNIRNLAADALKKIEAK